MKKTLLILFILGASLVAFAQTGNKFPNLTAKSLEGKTVEIPSACKGKFTLIAMAQSLNAQDALRAWINPARQTFMENPFFPVNVYFVPLVEGNIAKKAEQQLKEGLATEFHAFVLIPTSDISQMSKTLKMTDKDAPYFFVVNPEGKITHVVSGTYSEKKMEELADAMSE